MLHSPAGGGSLELSEVIDVEALKKYVLSRRAGDGGFAFCYPLPSSLPETYYAVYILSVLGVRIDDRDKLVKYLRSSLKNNPHSVYFVLKTLNLLGEELPDVSNFARERLRKAMGRIKVAEIKKAREIHELEAGITATYSFDMPNVLREVYSLVTSLRLLGVECDEIERAKEFVKLFRKRDGFGAGFGVKAPTLEDTYYAVSVIRKKDDDVLKFVMEREWKDGGFSKVPGSYPPYIEDTYFAVETLNIMGIRYKNYRTVRYLASLQNADGGFRRSVFLGTSSLEFSYYAVASLVRMR